MFLNLDNFARKFISGFALTTLLLLSILSILLFLPTDYKSFAKSFTIVVFSVEISGAIIYLKAQKKYL